MSCNYSRSERHILRMDDCFVAADSCNIAVYFGRNIAGIGRSDLDLERSLMRPDQYRWCCTRSSYTCPCCRLVVAGRL